MKRGAKSSPVREFPIGAVSAAWQPLADGINTWLSGGFSAKPPSTRGPAMRSPSASTSSSQNH